MVTAVFAIIGGLVLLVWSAGKFIDGAAATARHFGMSPLLIGMVIVGFGTSAPEMVVSVISALQGNPGLALGNAYGSNISNIALILGVTAVVTPVTVRSQVLRKELPLLAIVTLLAVGQLADGTLSRGDAWGLLAVFAGLMGWSVWQGLKRPDDRFGTEVAEELETRPETPLKSALVRLVTGLFLLVVSSRLLVWGAVAAARWFGVSDLVIGLTIVAIGTSLPELASSIMAALRREHEIALGNVVGSNLFNTLAVVGLAGVIQPMAVARELLVRDCLVMVGLTLSLFVVGYGFRGPGRINRYEGCGLLLAYAAYLVWLLSTTA